MKTFILLITLISSLFSNSLEKVSLQLKWKYQFQFAGFLIAKEKGFYKEAGLDVEIKEYTIGNDTVKDVISSKATFGISDSTLVLESIKGTPLVGLLAISQHSPYVLMGLKSSGIKTLKDLENKTIAVYDNVNGVAIAAMLKANEINFKANDVVYGLDKLISEKIDMQTAYVTNETFLAKEKGLDIVTFNPKDYGFDSYGDILFTSKKTIHDKPKMVEKFYQATKKGWLYALNNSDETVDMIFKKYNSLNKSKAALHYEAEEIKKITEYKKNFGDINLQKLKSISHLYAFMTSGRFDIDNLSDFIYKKEKIELTKEEKEYLFKKRTLKLCTTPNTMPLQGFSKDDKFIGLTADYVKKFSYEMGINIDTKKVKNWTESLQMIKEKKCDIISAMKTKDREEYLNFTSPYLVTSLVLATKLSVPFIDHFSKLDKQKIGIGKNYAYINKIKEIYPNLNLVYVDDIPSGLAMVKSGQLFGQLGTLPTIGYNFQNDYTGELKIAGKINKVVYQLSIASRNDEPILNSILEKQIANLNDTFHHTTLNQWLKIKYEQKPDYSFVYKVFGIGLLILLVILYKQVLLRQMNKKLEVEVKKQVEENRKKERLLFEQSKLASMGEMINNIAHQWRQPLTEINSTVMVLDCMMIEEKIKTKEVERHFENIEEQTKYMSETIEGFKNYFEPDKLKQKFSLEEAVKHSLVILEKAYVKLGIKLEVNIIKDIEVTGYKNEFVQVLIVILNNAKDALVEKNIQNPLIKITINQILSIEDNAKGIKEEIIGKVFEPYFTTKHPSVGTGLGLYMASSIIKDSMQGKIYVENTQEGAKFFIEIK